MQKPKPLAGMHHLALQVRDLQATESFYTNLLGMQVEWRPDSHNVYLTSGRDNLALHQLTDASVAFGEPQRLDHLGFIVEAPADVDSWHQFLVQQQVVIKAPPRTHRDGARSFYCQDPDGNVVQIIYHPPLAKSSKQGPSSL